MSAISENQPVGETTGAVKWFNADKGFGFITPFDGGAKDIFFHVKTVKKYSGQVKIFEGDIVTFLTEPAPKGPQVSKILIIKPATKNQGKPKTNGKSNGSRKAESTTPAVQRTAPLAGTVKSYNGTKGFGFITPDDGTADIFVHENALDESGIIVDIIRGDRVVITEFKPGLRGRPDQVARFELVD